jgi:quinol monooxygenase YgiN
VAITTERKKTMHGTVIAVYKPKPDGEEGLRALLRDHVSKLREWGLATDFPSTILKSSEGAYLEIFEWVSEEAVKTAHSHPGVQEMWEKFNEVCEYLPLASLEQSFQIFQGFERVEL